MFFEAGLSSLKFLLDLDHFLFAFSIAKCLTSDQICIVHASIIAFECTPQSCMYGLDPFIRKNVTSCLKSLFLS